jgi:mRNA interferase HigB
MIITGVAIVEDCLTRHRDRQTIKACKNQYTAWRLATAAANWTKFIDVRAQFGSADMVGDRVVFDICGNHYRLVARVDFEEGTVEIRFFDIHKVYDDIDVETV